MPLVASELGLSVGQKGTLLSAFPLGYMLTQVLGGAASDRYGGKPVMAIALYSIAVGIVAIGCLSDFDSMWWVMMLMGLLEGPSFPTNGVILSRWIPGTERASATAISDAGGPVGALVALFVTPMLASLFGWRLALGLAGLCTLAFALLWQLLAANGPDDCSSITAEEHAELIAKGVSAPAKAGAVDNQASSFPWRIIFQPSVWSVLLAHSAFNYNRYLMYNWIVTYYTDVLRVPVAEAAACMLWPNVCDAVTSLAVGKVADALANSGRMSILTTRRLFSTIGFLGTGVGALAIGSATGPAATTALVTFIASMQAFHNAGFKSSYGDLSQEYSGLLRGLGNTLASASSFAVPLLAAFLLESQGGSTERAAWQTVFQSVFICSVFGTASYVLLASAESVDGQLRAGKGSCWREKGHCGRGRAVFQSIFTCSILGTASYVLLVSADSVDGQLRPAPAKEGLGQGSQESKKDK